MAASLVGQKLGMYQITELLGQGGMATVYKGYRDDIDRYVAVKVLPPHPGLDHQFIDRFRLEAKTIARLQHPHILPLYDYGVENDIIYLVMAFVAGGSLADLMDKGTIPLPEIERILRQVASALDYAHRQGVIHRDIKPDNILLDKEGNVQLADFGIVKIVSGESDNNTNPALTQTGGLVGTPAYMAPEQGSGQANITARADLYSLGVVVYEMLTGEPPYTADTPMQVVIKHITEPVPNPRNVNQDLTPAMQNVIQRALAKKPDDRYATVTEFADDFARATRNEELLTQIPVSKAPVLTPSPNQTLEITNGPTPTEHLTPPPASLPQPTLIVQQGPNSLVLLGGFAIIAVLIVVVVLVVSNRPSTTPLPSTAEAAETTTEAPTQVAVAATQAPNFGSLNFSTKNSTGDTVTLQVQNLNPPAPDEIYVAWLKNTVTDRTLKLGQLTLNALGNGVLPPYTDMAQRTLPTFYNAVIVTREKKSAVGQKPVGEVAYSGSVPTAVMDALSAIYVTAPDGIASSALANTSYSSNPDGASTDSPQAGLVNSALAEGSIGQQHAGLAQAATTVGGMHLHNEHTINIFMGTEIDYDGDGRGTNPGFKKGVPLFLDDIEKVLTSAAAAPGGSDALHGNIESVRVCVANARKWVGQIVDLEKQMVKLDSVEAAVKIAEQSTGLAAALMNGVDANGSGQVDPYEDECGLIQIESYGLLVGSITLQQGSLAS
ncbi:MAG: protein kinase [Anaerolineaceae bacterium]|nr:protein kinase [Anaerolineaceae bacterium]